MMARWSSAVDRHCSIVASKGNPAFTIGEEYPIRRLQNWMIFCDTPWEEDAGKTPSRGRSWVRTQQ